MHFHPGAIAPTGKNQVHRRRKHCRSHPRASLLGVRSTITCASNATRANHSPGDVGVVAKDDKFVDVLVLNLGPADHDDKGTYSTVSRFLDYMD